jgi:hypothetical protein
MNYPSAHLEPSHAAHAQIARRLYLAARDPLTGAEDWRAALKEARRVIAKALRASSYLRDVSAALRQSGGHMLAFRHFLAPPISQDQFKLLCPAWPKTSERAEGQVADDAAACVAATFHAWRSKYLTVGSKSTGLRPAPRSGRLCWRCRR